MPLLKTQKLLIDVKPVSLQLVESTEGKIIARGEFGRADVPTDNKRIYSSKIFKREIEKLQDAIKERKVFGELDHPSDGKTRLSRVSHIITNLELTEDGRVIGEAEILDTDAGLNLQAILKSGGRVGVSSRGFGSVIKDSNGNEVVQDDFSLITFDFVALPATETAYPKFFIEEKEVNGMENMSLKEFIEKYPDLYNQVKNSIEEELKKKLKEEMNTIIENVRKEIKNESESSEDLKKILKEKDDEIEDLKKRIEDLTIKNEELEKRIIESLELAKKLGYGLYLEKKLDDVEDRDVYRKFIDIGSIKSKKEIDEQINVIKKKLENEERKRVYDESRYNILNKKIKKLEEQLEMYKKGLEKSIELSKELGLRAYLEKVASSHPKGMQLRKLYENGSIRTKEDIDNWKEEIGQASRFYEDIRQRIGKGFEYLREEDRFSEKKEPISESVKEIEGIAGVSLDTLEKLAGIKNH